MFFVLYLYVCYSQTTLAQCCLFFICLIFQVLFRGNGHGVFTFVMCDKEISFNAQNYDWMRNQTDVLSVINLSGLQHIILPFIGQWDLLEGSRWINYMMIGMQKQPVNHRHANYMCRRYVKRIISYLVNLPQHKNCVRTYQINNLYLFHHLINGLIENKINLKWKQDEIDDGWLIQYLSDLLFTNGTIMSLKEKHKFIANRLELLNIDDKEEDIWSVIEFVQMIVQKFVKLLLISLGDRDFIAIIQSGLLARHWRQYLQDDVMKRYSRQFKLLIQKLLKNMVDIDQGDCLTELWAKRKVW